MLPLALSRRVVGPLVGVWLGILPSNVWILSLAIMCGGVLVAKFTSAGVVCCWSMWCPLDFSKQYGVFSGPNGTKQLPSACHFS